MLIAMDSDVEVFDERAKVVVGGLFGGENETDGQLGAPRLGRKLRAHSSACSTAGLTSLLCSLTFPLPLRRTRETVAVLVLESLAKLALAARRWSVGRVYGGIRTPEQQMKLYTKRHLPQR